MNSVETVPAAGENVSDRKADHIRLALERRMQLESRYFDQWVFVHEALPDVDFDEIEVSTPFLGRTLAAPLLISCMTGGTEEASRINRHLALAAEATGVALGVGSQRKALEDPSKEASFKVRELCPSIPLLGNLGAVQLNYGYGLDACRRAVEMIEADALVLHLNVVQEALQPEGDRNFKGLLPKIGEVVAGLEVPVIVKEVGCGISGATARRLREVGVRYLDVAGLGGTSWARIEAARAEDLPLGELFAGWGIPTPRSIREAAAVEGLAVIGSGGLRSGLDAAKALALGADLAGLAFPFLAAARHSPEKVVEKVERTVRELKISMQCCGAGTLHGLRAMELLERSVPGGRP